MIWRLIRSTSLAVAIAILLAPASTFADVLILKNGDQVHGRFANRQMLRTDPFSLKRLTIDAGTGGAVDLQSYPFADVQYLVFEGDNGQRDVIDLQSVKGASVPVPTAAWPPARQFQVDTPHNHKGSAAMMLAGVAGLVTGAAVKFGEKSHYNEFNQIETEKQYNTINWITMSFGAALLVFGAYSFTKSAQEPTRPVFSVRDDGGVLVGMQTQF